MRMINKLPQTPQLNDKIIHLITTLLFLKDKKILTKDTVYQIFGNIAFLDDLTAKVKELGKNKNIIISGGINPEYKNNTQESQFVKMLYTKGGVKDWNDVLNKSEAEIIKTELSNNGINDNFILEQESTNCKENIMKCVEANLYKDVKNLAIITTKEQTLRAKLTAKKYLPNVNVSTIGYTATVKNMNISVDENNWIKNYLSKQYVWGEFLRIAKYSSMGEFNLTETMQNKLNLIIKEIEKLNSKDR